MNNYQLAQAPYEGSPRYFADVAASKNMVIGPRQHVRAPVGHLIRDVFVEFEDIWYLSDTYSTRFALERYRTALLTLEEVRRFREYVAVLNDVIDEFFAMYVVADREPEGMRRLIVWEHVGPVVSLGPVVSCVL